jgi:uncharacterized protein (TIGR03382 family)
MRQLLFFLVAATTLVASSARAQCQDGGVGCQPATSVTVSGIPAITAAPLLDIDAVVQDHGAVFVNNPNTSVFVTVSGSSADGGAPVLPDGGVSTSGSLVAPLTLVSFGSDGGVFAAAFAGLTPLFLGDNTVTVSAIRPPGTRFDSAPQLVRLDPSFNGGSSDGGATGDGGVPTDGGSGGGPTPDGGVVTDGGGGGVTLPDGGVQSAGAALVVAAGDSGGCSTTSSGPPSFFLMALTVMLAALGRRGMRS